ncbi:Mediator of RNA polymerase II transcription subunit 4 [Collariella sp. IMI 366227]|nr:Mediator of RNA polymerase II transcription subunit 4 [Collariella sp. IMI 366227]
MDKDIDARYERLEKALAAMIDSLAKNHPSERLAKELFDAQGELYKGLELLETHQNNHAKLQELRQQTSLLDTQIKDTHTALWAMRKELKAVPVSSETQLGTRFPFTTSDLLSFARRISRNTLPRPGVTNGVDLNPPAPSPPPSPNPTKATIRSGGLAAIQRLIDRGDDDDEEDED